MGAPLRRSRAGGRAGRLGGGTGGQHQLASGIRRSKLTLRIGITFSCPLSLRACATKPGFSAHANGAAAARQFCCIALNLAAFTGAMPTRYAHWGVIKINTIVSCRCSGQQFRYGGVTAVSVWLMFASVCCRGFVAGNNRMKIATRIIISLLCFAGAVFFIFRPSRFLPAGLFILILLPLRHAGLVNARIISG